MHSIQFMSRLLLNPLHSIQSIHLRRNKNFMWQAMFYCILHTRTCIASKYYYLVVWTASSSPYQLWKSPNPLAIKCNSRQHITTHVFPHYSSTTNSWENTGQSLMHLYTNAKGLLCKFLIISKSLVCNKLLRQLCLACRVSHGGMRRYSSLSLSLSLSSCISTHVSVSLLLCPHLTVINS